MTKYEEVNPKLKEKLEAICIDNPTNINPKLLYINIVNSKGSIQMLAVAFNVSEELITEVKRINKKQDG